MDTIFDQLTLTRNEDGGYTVTACDKAAVSVTVPETVDGIPITAIGDGAFEDCVRLCEIFLPEAGELAFLDNMGLTKIGEYAFSGCKSLKRIELPESIGTVGRGAFHGCTAMTAAVLPQWVYLAPYAFSGCRALRKISPIKTVSEGLFTGCVSLEAITLKDSCKEVDDDAFEHCESLREITLPRNVSRVGALAFRGCFKLEKVIFLDPDGWYSHNRYREEDVKIDVSDPKKNAKCLREADFDDGGAGWYKR
ncbi:MAG: leucine-rich repeat domain-containing protein [Clostridia bacterium]|nr:leucine-rich repeat domain-containing protein [Clostridia bacterium]